MDSFVKFNSGSSIYWSNKLKCEYLQRLIIVHSIIYYELSDNVIDDKQFDILCKQLLDLQKETYNYEQTYYYDLFKDFKGETGYYLYDRLKPEDKFYLTGIAKVVLYNFKKGGSDK